MANHPAHFCFQSSGSHFLDLANIKLEQDECPEDLLYYLTVFFKENLLTISGSLKDQGEPHHEDEEVTPSLDKCHYPPMATTPPQRPTMPCQTAL